MISCADSLPVCYGAHHIVSMSDAVLLCYHVACSPIPVSEVGAVALCICTDRYSEHASDVATNTQ